MTADLVSWLRAQLDAGEKAQRDSDYSWHNLECESVPSRWRSETGNCDCGIPAQVLADIAAKRRILHVHVDQRECERCAWFGDEHHPCETLCLVASVYADRAGYDESWRA